MSATAESEQVNHLEARRKTAADRKLAWQSKVRAEAEHAQKNLKPTRKQRALITLLQDKFPGYQPVMEMAERAWLISAIADRRPNDAIAQMDAVNAHEKVAKYVTPQLKAIDVTSGGEQIQFGFQLNLANITK